jgi:hypothetical protein
LLGSLKGAGLVAGGTAPGTCDIQVLAVGQFARLLVVAGTTRPLTTRPRATDAGTRCGRPAAVPDHWPGTGPCDRDCPAGIVTAMTINETARISAEPTAAKLRMRISVLRSGGR